MVSASQSKEKLHRMALGILGILVFAALLIAAVCLVNSRLTSKGTEYGYYSAQSAHEGFYSLTKNSADVLFLGSSHCYCGFSPQVLYDDFGITSWNLGSSQQSVWLSYYWLKEALKTQKPAAVVMEVFYVTTSEGMGGDEPSVHWALDSMKWSGNKLEAIRSCMEERPEITYLSFLFRNVRYHERIFDLKENDYPGNSGCYGGLLKGYIPLSGAYGTQKEVFSPLDLSIREAMPFYPKAETYLARIADLCEENGISLLFAKTPTTHWSAQEHNTIESFAGSRGIPFYDMNEGELYDQIGYDLAADNHDYGHANTRGARKITDFIGGILTGACDLAAREDAQWVKTRRDSERIVGNCELAGKEALSNAAPYLSALKELIGAEGYTILLAGDQTDGAPFPAAVTDGLGSLGIDTSVFADGKAFTAVLRSGNLSLDIQTAGEGAAQQNGSGSGRNGNGRSGVSGTDTVYRNGLLPGNLQSYELKGAGTDLPGSGEILIDGKRVSSKKEDGIHLLLYDSRFSQIVDNVCIGKDGMIHRD